MNQEIYERLKDVSKKGRVTYYSEIAPLAGLDMSYPADRAKIGELLGEISTFENEQGHPMLSTVVVYRQYNMPGPGFFKLARWLGIYRGDDDFLFFIRELRKVHDYWQGVP